MDKVDLYRVLEADGSLVMDTDPVTLQQSPEIRLLTSKDKLNMESSGYKLEPVEETEQDLGIGKKVAEKVEKNNLSGVVESQTTHDKE